jgi:hypothetical protein
MCRPWHKSFQLLICTAKPQPGPSQRYTAHTHTQDNRHSESINRIPIAAVSFFSFNFKKKKKGRRKLPPCSYITSTWRKYLFNRPPNFFVGAGGESSSSRSPGVGWENEHSFPSSSHMGLHFPIFTFTFFLYSHTRRYSAHAVTML